MLKELIVKTLTLPISDEEREQKTPVTVGPQAGFSRTARRPPDNRFDVVFLQKEAERYRSEARKAASEQGRNFYLAMSSFSETMAANEKMRAWLERSIQELMAEQTGDRRLTR